LSYSNLEALEVVISFARGGHHPLSAAVEILKDLQEGGPDQIPSPTNRVGEVLDLLGPFLPIGVEEEKTLSFEEEAAKSLLMALLDITEGWKIKLPPLTR